MSGASVGEELLERDADLDEAARMRRAAGGGSGGALLVVGPAGIGKSALIRAIRDRASADGFTVLAARGAELEREFSFGVVRQLLEPAVAVTPERERARLFSGAARPAATAIGELHLDDPNLASPSLDPSFAVLHGLYWLTANLAERGPLLIAVDDAHWADPASLRFLVYLAGRLEGLPAMLVVGMRPAEPGSAVELLSALESEPASRVLRVAALSQAGTEILVRSRLEDAAGGFAAACHSATQGNPQLIRELLVALAAEGIEPTPAGAERVAALRADRIAASVLARVGRAGRVAVALARAVAVLGRDATVPLATELVEVDPEEAAAGVDTLTELEVIDQGEVLAYVHPIVRAAIYNDMQTTERAALHARAARLLAHTAASSSRSRRRSWRASPRAIPGRSGNSATPRRTPWRAVRPTPRSRSSSAPLRSARARRSAARSSSRWGGRTGCSATSAVPSGGSARRWGWRPNPVAAPR